MSRFRPASHSTTWRQASGFCHTLTLAHSHTLSLSLPNPGQHRSKAETLIINHNHPVSIFEFYATSPSPKVLLETLTTQNRTSVELGLAAPPNRFTTIPLNPPLLVPRLSHATSPDTRPPVARLPSRDPWAPILPAPHRAPGIFFWSGLFLSSDNHRRLLFSREC